MSNTKDLQSLSLKELQNRVNECKKELMNLRFQRSTEKLETTDGFRKVRRSVARIKTVMAQKIRAEHSVKKVVA